MANQVKGEATVRLGDGRELTLCLDFDALCAIEEVLDRPIVEIFDELERAASAAKSPRLGTVRALVYGGLRKHHPEITLTEAGDLVANNVSALSQGLSKAQAGGAPRAKAEGKKGANPRRSKAAVGTG